MVDKLNVMDFADLDTKTAADAGVEVEIMKADGDTTGMFIKVLGTDSNQYQKLREKFERARIRKLAKGGRNSTDALYDDAKANDLEMVAACTVGWRHESKQMPFDVNDKDALIGFYDKYPLVLDQVRVAMNDRSLFTQASGKH